MALLTAGLILGRAGHRRGGGALIVSGLAVIWLAAMPVTARFALGLLERQYPVEPVVDMPSADVAVVLGGGIDGMIPPRQNIELGDAADRVYLAAELFKAGKVKAILVSGGNLPWTASARPEAEDIRTLLISWGVPPDAIKTGGESRTTAENAREVKALWPSLGASSALLVTSAAHMPRALASFRKAGIPVIPAPADIRSVDDTLTLLDFLPDARALADTTAAAKEAAGYAVYWARGDL